MFVAPIPRCALAPTASPRVRFAEVGAASQPFGKLQRSQRRTLRAAFSAAVSIRRETDQSTFSGMIAA
jgi:hypothetical protein